MVKKLDCPVFLVLNKIDAIDTKESLLPLIAQFSALHPFAEVIPISARSGDGLERLVDKLVEYMPEGRAAFSQRSVHGSAGTFSGGGNHPRENLESDG